jgi:hypothetical protein
MRGVLRLLVVVAALPGCGALYYTASISAAESRLEEARAAGAERAAPYEYTYAKEHLREAQRQAAEASYGDAANYADVAEAYAQRAIDRAKRGESAQ